MVSSGYIYRITNLTKFIGSYILNPNSPDSSTFEPFPRLQVNIGSAINLPSFFPLNRVRDITGADGSFTLDIGDLNQAIPMYLVAYELSSHVNHMGYQIPIYGPVYRSETFKAQDVNNAPRNIYVYQESVEDRDGTTQAQIAREVAKAKRKIPNVESLSAFITEDGINVVGKGKGATISFKVQLSPDTSSNLDSFLKHKIRNYDIDLPGWDFVSALCVDENEIEKEVRDGVSALVKDINDQVIDQIASKVVSSTGTASALVATLLEQQTSISFNAVRYPVIEVKDLVFRKLKIRSMVADPCISIPKKLY